MMIEAESAYTLRLLGLLCAMSLAASACSGGNAESGGTDELPAVGGTASAPSADDGEEDVIDTPVAPEAPLPTQPRPTEIELLVDTETGDLVEVEVEARGPATFDEVVDFGIEAGLWDEIEGLRRVLGYAVGAVPPEQAPGVADIVTGELNALLERANALALSGAHTEEELADLRRWYELAVPTDGVLAMLVTGAGGDFLPNSGRSSGDAGKGPAPARPLRGSAGRVLGLAQAQAQCVPVDPEDFSGWAVIEGCYELLEDEVEGVMLRVLYPSWYSEDPTLANLPLLARDALVESVTAYSSLGEIGDMTAVFSLTETAGSGGDTLAVATDNALWGTATTAGACPITIFPVAGGASGEAFQQTLAHEAWHCVQHYSSYPLGVPSGTAWFVEAGAEYFSNVVYPEVNDEHVWLSTFDSDSRTVSLLDMSYEAWIWWQFVGNRESPRFVADMQQQMADAGDGGAGAMSTYGPVFQRFVVEFVAGSISDANGSKLRHARFFNKPNPTVKKNDAGKTLVIAAQPFVSVRYAVEYDKELRVFESDQTTTTGEIAMVEFSARLDPSAWRQVYPEVRSRCKSKTYYVVVATTAVGSHEGKIQVDRIEEASCDPCVLGTWELDLATFGAMLRAAMAAEGGALPPGTSFEFSGNYYTSMDDQGVMREQREPLIISIGAAEGAISFTIRSFAEGRYTADGERMAAFDVVQSFVSVTTSVLGFGAAGFEEGSSVIGGALGEYECRTDDMTMTVDGLEPIRWIRVDKILKPPTTVAPRPFS